jgi:hypothetical protein
MASVYTEERQEEGRNQANRLSRLVIKCEDLRALTKGGGIEMQRKHGEGLAGLLKWMS